MLKYTKTGIATGGVIYIDKPLSLFILALQQHFAILQLIIQIYLFRTVVILNLFGEI